MVEYLPQIVDSTVKALIVLAPELIKASVKIIGALAGGLIDAIPDLLKSIPQIIASIVGGLLDGLSDIKDVGGQLLEGLWDGIGDKVEWLKGKVGGVVNTIKSWFTGKDGFDEHSPSRWAADVFEKLMEGGGEGLKDALPNLMGTVGGIVGNVKDAFNSPIDFALAGGGGMDYGSMMGYNQDRPIEIVINLTEELDGSLLARKTFRYFMDEAHREGVGDGYWL